MGLSNSKLDDSTLKLIFPSHGLPFVVPFAVLPELETKIDDILKDMEQKTPTPKESWKLKLRGGRVLESPSPGDWILVDVANSSLIHCSVMGVMVVKGATYMVLPIRTSDLTEEDLGQAIRVGKPSNRDEGLPPYN